ncbi:MAG: hypothetical protein LQ351_007844 [Letrouitia transgressa]|nr:MAG: hypothetical protein LQ351_007844 [Letrouitia transgressa]
MEWDGQVMTEVSHLPAHTDWCSFTLSFQDTTGGLEFKEIHSGAFTPAVPRSDAVYLNVGDMMELLLLTKQASSLLAPIASSFQRESQHRTPP